MKGKRYTTEEKIRILREGDGSKSILEVCRERNIGATLDIQLRLFQPLQYILRRDGLEWRD